jgi:hypothetical protein
MSKDIYIDISSGKSEVCFECGTISFEPDKAKCQKDGMKHTRKLTCRLSRCLRG